MERRGLLVGLFAAPALISAARADTTDLAVGCAAPLGALMRAAAVAYRTVTGVRVDVFPTPPRLLLAQIARQVQIDIVVSRLDDMRQAAQRNLLQPPPFTGPWNDPLVIAGRRGIARDAALAGVVALPDPGTAAELDGPAILAGMGLRPARPIGVVDTREGAAMLVAGTAQAALLFRSEVRADPMLGTLAPVPAALAPDTRIAAAISMDAGRPDPQRFLQYLASAPGRRLLADYGLEELA